jgi:hypothetical protein
MGVRGQVFGVRVRFRVSPGEAQYLDRLERSCSSAWVLWGHWGTGVVVGNPRAPASIGVRCLVLRLGVRV